jgi:hypothetical protein
VRVGRGDEGGGPESGGAAGGASDSPGAHLGEATLPATPEPNEPA